MAIDETLLDRAGRAGEGWLRLYRWDPWCLSFGRHEPASRRYDRAAIERRGLAVVRRPTGGRAVWHARELTYAVALPADTIAGGLRGAYHEIHAVVRDALRKLGVAAELAAPGPAQSVAAASCFGRAVGGEIVVAGRKVVGSAQVREAGGLLQQGAILLRDDQELVRDVTLGAALPDASAPLERVVGRSIREAELAGAIFSSARLRWRGDGTDGDDAEPEVLLAAAARASRYASREWTWRA